jgi:uncharacterized membrane protein
MLCCAAGAPPPGLRGNALPCSFHELVVAPVVLLLAFRQAARALGARRALAELGALVVYGYALEAVAMAVFQSHRYSSGWLLSPGGVPLAVAAVWAAVIASVMALAGLRHPAQPLRVAAWAALLGVSLDLLVEPVATRLALWAWTPPGPWLLVPLGNFVGWSVIVGAYAYGAERFGGISRGLAAAAERALLAAACVGALVMVGLAWRGLQVEERLTAPTGWLFAACAWALCAWGVPRAPRAGGRESGLATRLGATPSREPAAVLLVLAATFALYAALLREPQRLVLALLVLMALGVAVGRAAPPLSPGRASSS